MLLTQGKNVAGCTTAHARICPLFLQCHYTYLKECTALRGCGLHPINNGNLIIKCFVCSRATLVFGETVRITETNPFSHCSR